MALNYNILSKEEVLYFKNNKDQITFDLLQALRSHGNPGKQLALEILDFNKDYEGYYLDAFERRITYDGMITLKKPNTKMNLSPIHLEEIERCSLNTDYFSENYCKIVTQSGTNFMNLRHYQKSFLKDMVTEESVCSLQSRQSGKCSGKDSNLDIINKDNLSYSTSFENLFEECKKEFNEQKTAI